jgi:hypothetical protein
MAVPPTSPTSIYSTGASPVEVSSYFLVVDGHRLGPLTAEQLALYVLSAESWIWRSGWSDWRRLGDVPELRSLLSAPPIPAHVSSASPSAQFRQTVRAFRRAMPFLLCAALSLLLVDPLLLVLALGGLYEFVPAAWPWIVAVVTRLWSFVAAGLLAQGMGMSGAWLRATPALIHPFIGLVWAGGLGVIAQRRLRQAGVRFGFFGPKI